MVAVVVAKNLHMKTGSTKTVQILVRFRLSFAQKPVSQNVPGEKPHQKISMTLSSEVTRRRRSTSCSPALVLGHLLELLVIQFRERDNWPGSGTTLFMSGSGGDFLFFFL